jgi:hypothetical protein
MKQPFYISLIIFLGFINLLKAQELKSTQFDIKICDIIEIIDSAEFSANRQPYQDFDTTTLLKKLNGVINVQGKDTTFQFKDNTSDEHFFEYKCSGVDIIKKKVLILGQNYQQNFYYLIDQNTNRIDTLIGYPKIFGDRYLCEEDAYTDGTAFIEIWNIKNDIPFLFEKFSFIPCDIYSIDESYLTNNYLFVKYNSKKYIKVKLQKL